MLENQDKFAEAAPLLREALDGYRRSLGDEHIVTILSMNSLAHVLKTMGKLAESEELFREALGSSGASCPGPSSLRLSKITPSCSWTLAG